MDTKCVSLWLGVCLWVSFLLFGIYIFVGFFIRGLILGDLDKWSWSMQGMYVRGEDASGTCCVGSDFTLFVFTSTFLETARLYGAPFLPVG